MKWKRPRGREDGASAVEFALIAPVVFAIALGGITGGLAFNTQQSLNHAAREAARFAATADSLDLEAIAEYAVGSAAGQLHEDAPGRHICVAYVGATTEQYPSGDEPCFDDGRGDGEDEPRVQVSVGRDVDFIGVLYNRVGEDALSLRSSAVARHEPTS